MPCSLDPRFPTFFPCRREDYVRNGISAHDLCFPTLQNARRAAHPCDGAMQRRKPGAGCAGLTSVAPAPVRESGPMIVAIFPLAALREELPRRVFWAWAKRMTALATGHARLCRAQAVRWPRTASA